MQIQYGPGVSEEVFESFQKSLLEDRNVVFGYEHGLSLFHDCNREQVLRLAKIHPPVILQMRSSVLEDVHLLRIVLPLSSSVDFSYKGVLLYEKLPEHIKERDDILMAVPWKETSTNYLSEKVWLDTDKFAKIIWNCIAVAMHLKIPREVDVLNYFEHLLNSIEKLEPLNGFAYHYGDNQPRKAFHVIYYLYRVLPEEYRKDIEIFDIFYNKIKSLREKSWDLSVSYGGENVSEEVLLLNADGDLLCQKKYFEKYLTNKSMLVDSSSRFFNYELFKNEKFSDLVKYILEENPENYILTRAYSFYDEEHLFQNMDKYATNMVRCISIVEFMEYKKVSKEFILKYASYNPDEVLEIFLNSGNWDRYWNNKMDFFCEILDLVPKSKLDRLRSIDNLNSELMDGINIKELIQKYPEIYPCLNISFRCDREITQIAIDSLPSNKASVGKIFFLSDEDVLAEGDDEIRLGRVIEYNNELEHWLSKDVFENNFTLYKRRASFFYYFENLPFIKEAMKKDREWAYEMIKNGDFPKDIRIYFKEEDLRDVEFVQKLMAINSRCYEFLDRETQENKEIINSIDEFFFCREKTILENRPDLLTQEHVIRLLFYTLGDMTEVFKKLKATGKVSEKLLKDIFYDECQNKPVLVNTSYMLFKKNIFSNMHDIQLIINSLDRDTFYREVLKEVPFSFIEDDTKFFTFLEKYQNKFAEVNLAYCLWNQSFFECWNKEYENVSFDFAIKDKNAVQKILSRFDDMKMREDLKEAENKLLPNKSKLSLKKF